MAQRDKQKMLLSMDGMVSRLPDKGRSIEVRIEALEKEIAAAKAELRAKHGAGVPATEASKSAAMAALDAHIARATPARAPLSDKTVQGASEEPRGDGGSDPEVKGAASPRDTDDGVDGDAGDDGDDGDEEAVDVPACADDESIAGTDDGDDAGSSPTRSTTAPAPPLRRRRARMSRTPRDPPTRFSRPLPAPPRVRGRWTTSRRCSMGWACAERDASCDGRAVVTA